MIQYSTTYSTVQYTIPYNIQHSMIYSTAQHQIRPPPVCNGWLCFVVALIMIGLRQKEEKPTPDRMLAQLSELQQGGLRLANSEADHWDLELI